MGIRPLVTRMFRGFLCSLFFLAGPLAVLAQQEPADDPATAKPSAPANDWERLVYLPYKNLKQVFEKESATVFMPYAEFLELWAGRAKGTNGGGKPPVAAVISRADYRGTIVKDLAQVEVTFTVQVLGRPWAEIPLSFGDAAVGKLTSNDKRILLRGTGEGTYALMLPTKGEHTVTLELTTRVRTSPDGRSFALKCPPVGITNFDLTVPAADQTVAVSPHLVSTPAKAEGNVTRVTASLGATATISARWHPRVSTAPEMELLASVDNTSDVRVADGLIHTHASLKYKILRGNLDQVRIAVPSGRRILDVSAASLKGWQATQEQAGQIITVDLLPGKAKSITIDVHTEQAVPKGVFSVAGVDAQGIVQGIHATGAVRESGIIAIGHAPDITLPVEKQTGLVRIESAEIPGSLRRPGGMYFKFYTRDFDLQVTAKPVEPRVVVNQQTRLEFRDEELHLDAFLVYTVERAGLFELRYQLPPGFKVETVNCEPMEKYSVSEASQELVISLSSKTLGNIGVEIGGNIDFRAGKEKKELKLPLLTPLGVTRETGAVYVFAPEAIEIVTDEDSVIAAQPIRPRGVVPATNMRLASAWSYSRRPFEISVTTLRKPTRLTATVAAQVTVKQELVEVSTLLDYRIQYAGIDTFVFSVPETVGDVRIEQVDSGGGTAIKQRSKADEAVEGWVAWTIVMQHDVTGNQRFRVKYDLKPTQSDGAAEIQVEPLRVMEIPANEARGTAAVAPTRVYGEIAIDKDRALTISASTESLESIDVRELKYLSHDANLAYRYFKQPVDLTLKASKHEIQEVVETVVARALIEAVVTDDAARTYRCRYRITSSERQRLAIDLPAAAELLGVTVAGRKGALERNPAGKAVSGWESYFVNVARTGNSDEPFYLSLLFRVDAQAFEQWGGKLPILLPRIGGGEAVPVQQLRVAAWVPKNYALVGEPDQFSTDRSPRLHWSPGAVSSTTGTKALDNWIGGDSAGLFEFPTAGHAYSYTNLGGANELTVTFWRSSIYVLVISGTVFLVALLLSRTSWDNKLSVIVIVAFGMALSAIRYPNISAHLFSAALPGLVAMIVIWLVHGLFRVRPHRVIADGKPFAAVVVPPPGIFESLNSALHRKSDGDT